MPNKDLPEIGEVEEMDNAQKTFNDYIAGEVRGIKAWQKAMAKQLAANTKKTNETYDIVLLFKGAGEFLTKWGSRFRTAAIWLTPILVFFGSVYHFFMEYKKAKGD